MRILTLSLLLLQLCLPACNKKTATPAEEEASILIFKNECVIEDIYWLDNETILASDHCEGTFKIANTTTKTRRLIIRNQNHLPQEIFGLPNIPNKFFYTATTLNSNGSFSEPKKLFSYNISTGTLTTILDSFKVNRLTVLGNKKIAFQFNNEVLVVDAEMGTSQKISITGTVKSFSPDDNQLLVTTSLQNQYTDAFKYDLSCQCTIPITFNLNSLKAADGIIWHPQGFFGYTTYDTLKVVNLETGALLKKYNQLQGPWISKNASIITSVIKEPGYSTDEKGTIVNYNMVTGESKSLLKVASRPLSSYLIGVFSASVSPDQKKACFCTKRI